MTPAGLRAIDAQVAEKVMGHKLATLAEYEAEARRVWAKQPSCLYFHGLGGFIAYEEAGAVHVEPNVPAYSTDIAAAWRVVERLRERGWSVVVESHGKHREWTCWVQDDTENEPVMPDADTVQLAICLAALRACGVEIPEATP